MQAGKEEESAYRGAGESELQSGRDHVCLRRAQITPWKGKEILGVKRTRERNGDRE